METVHVNHGGVMREPLLSGECFQTLRARVGLGQPVRIALVVAELGPVVERPTALFADVSNVSVRGMPTGVVAAQRARGGILPVAVGAGELLPFTVDLVGQCGIKMIHPGIENLKEGTQI